MYKYDDILFFCPLALFYLGLDFTSISKRGKQENGTFVGNDDLHLRTTR